MKNNKRIVSIIIGVVLLLVLFLLIRSCSSPKITQESLMKESIEVVENMNQTLSSITDEESAESAKEKLVKLNQEMGSLKARSETLGKLSGAERAELEKLPGYEKAMTALKQEFLRLTKDKDALNIVLESIPAFDTK